MTRLPIVLSATALALAVLGTVPGVQAAAEQIIRPRSVAAKHIRSGAIQPRHLSKSTRAWINAKAPAVKARGVTVSNGQRGERIRLHGGNISDGDLLGQFEYLGGLTCPSLGPWAKLEATFFDANGVVVATGIGLEDEPAPNTRYPLEVFGKDGAVRAEVVLSVDCS